MMNVRKILDTTFKTDDPFILDVNNLVSGH